MRRLTLTALACASSLVLTACGGDDSSAPDPGNENGRPAAEQTSATTADAVTTQPEATFTPDPGRDGAESLTKLFPNAVEEDDGAVRLTDAVPWDLGAAWNPDEIDLTEDFSVEFTVYLGDSDDGADGIAFILAPEPQGAFAGGGLGYAGFVGPSVAIEIDTFYNPEGEAAGFHFNDPTEEDHVAVLEDGLVDHLPERPIAPITDVEDGDEHDFAVSWSAAESTLTVALDDVVLFDYQRDLQHKFDGPVVYGVTGATGDAYNLQYIR